jgi:hypothetical protein
MQLRKSWFPIVAIGLFLIAAVILVPRQLARNTDRANSPQRESPQLQGKSERSSQSKQPRLLPDNPDGLEFERTAVTGAPFAATLITESSEQMPDGTRLTKTTTSLIYRDDKGRTRRDWFAESTSQASIENAVAERSIINDPVAGSRYQLNHRGNIAQETVFFSMPPQNSRTPQSAATTQTTKDNELPLPGSDSDKNLRSHAMNGMNGMKPESLGVRSIEGVLAEGTRFNFNLPAGPAGNDQPVEISLERWYAPSLQASVLIRRTQSQVFETSYRVIDIKRGEPAAALFVAPSSYKLLSQTGKEISNGRKRP